MASVSASCGIDLASCDDKEPLSGVVGGGDSTSKKIALSKLSLFKRTWAQSNILQRNFVKKKPQFLSSKEESQQLAKTGCIAGAGVVVFLEGNPSPPQGVCVSNNNTTNNEGLIVSHEKNGLVGLVSDKAAGFGNSIIGSLNQCNLEGTNSSIKPGPEQGTIGSTRGCHKVPCVIKDCDIINESVSKGTKEEGGAVSGNNLEGGRVQESINHDQVKEREKSYPKPTYSDVNNPKPCCVWKTTDRNRQSKESNTNSFTEICQGKKTTNVSTKSLNYNLQGNTRKPNSAVIIAHIPGIVECNYKSTEGLKDTGNGECEQDNNNFNEFLSAAFGSTQDIELSKGRKQHPFLGQLYGTHTTQRINETGLHLSGPQKVKRESLFGDVTPEKRTLLSLSPGGSTVSRTRVGNADSVCNYKGQVNACLHDTSSSPSYPYRCDTEVKPLPASLSSGISTQIYTNRKSDSTHVNSDSELLLCTEKREGICVLDKEFSELSDEFNNSGIAESSESSVYVFANAQRKLTSLCAGVHACNGDSLAQNQPQLQTTTLDLRKKLERLPKTSSSSTSDQKEQHNNTKSQQFGEKAGKKLVQIAGFIEEISCSKIQIPSSGFNTGEWRSERPLSVLERKGHNKRVVQEHGVDSVLEPSDKKHRALLGCDTSTSEHFVSSQRDKISLYKGKYRVSLDHHTTVSSTLSLGSSVSSKSSSKSSKKLCVKDLDKLVTNTKPKVHHNVGYSKITKDRRCSAFVSTTTSNISLTSGGNSVDKIMYNPRYAARDSAKQEASVMSNTSQDSGFVPGLVITKEKIPYGYQSGSSSRCSDSSCLSSAQGRVEHTSRKQPHTSHCRPEVSGQSDTSYGVDASSEDQQCHLQSRSYYDFYQQKPYHGQDFVAWREYPEVRHSGHRPVISVDSVSLESSQASSLCLVTEPGRESSELVVGTKPSHRFEGHLPVKGVVLREKRNQKRKSRKNREWGTVGNIPDVTENDTSKQRTRPKSFGAGEMYKTRRSCEMIDRIESESEDSDSSIDVDNFEDFSMAEDDSQVGGCSLDDKLRLAANKGQIERIPTLLAQGAGFQPDKEGRTAIHYAALSGHSEVVRILGANGCDVNTKDNLGYTALHRAAAQGHTDVVKVLCECGCNLNIQDDVHGNSALHEAAWNGYSRTVDILCRHKANVHLMNKAGFSALHLAAQNGHNQSGRSLLYANCDPNHKNNYGDTPLHTAGRYGHAGVTRILLSAKCRISEQNKNGDTALHISAALKRKKIAKLLVESNINTSIKNKQNETASDVARRKEHHEIIVIVTSQAKLYKQKKKEDKKKKKEGKFSGIEESDDPRKDKKMFFFKKRSKSKDNKENKENRDASADRLDGRQGRGVSSSMDAQAGVVSEAVSNNSSGRGTISQLAGDQLRMSRDTHKSRSSSRERAVAKSQGTSTAAERQRLREQKVHGLLTQYEPKTGVQYYRDLAGNVKQGPIGFAPVCNCGPSIKKIEQRMEADRNNMYDHIDATHKMLTHQIEDVDHKCCERVQSASHKCRQQADEQARTQEAFVNSRVLQERQDTEQMMQFQEHLMRAEYMDYMSHKLGAFEEHYAPMKSNCRGCEHGKPHDHHNGHYRDDNDLNPTRAVHGAQQPQTGGLYRSKSDETLSVSSSKRHWKMKPKPKSIRQIKDGHGKGAKGHKGSYRTGYESSATTASRLIPQGEVVATTQMVYQTSTPLSQEDKLQSSSGRTPEGQSSNNEYSEHNSYLDPVGGHYGTWNSRRKPALNTPGGLTHGMSQEKDSMRQDFEKLTVRDYPQSSLSNGHSTSTPVSQPASSRPPSSVQPEQQQQQHYPLPQRVGTPDSLGGGPPYSTTNEAYNAPYNTPTFNSPVNYNTPNSSYNTTNNTHNSSSRLTTSGTSSSSYILSPDQVQVHHVKTDSGSNPDSGYSSKIYGMRPAVSGRSISTTQGSPNAPYPVNGPTTTAAHLPYPVVIAQQQPSQLIDTAVTHPVKPAQKNRGYSSDGCPGMRRPKQDAYASDNCAGMRMKKALPHKSALNDWYEKQVSSKGNGVITEVPTPPLLQHPQPPPPTKAKDFWPGKATQV